MNSRRLWWLLLGAVLAGCPRAVPDVVPAGRGRFVFDTDSDQQLAALTPTLLPGTYVYGVHFMLPDRRLTDPADVETIEIAARGAGLRAIIERRSVDTDRFGRFQASPDGSGSAETVQRLLLPGRALGPGDSWSRDRGHPLDTRAELAALDAKGLAISKTVVDSSTALGAKRLPGGGHLVAIKRTLRAYVPPSRVARGEGVARAKQLFPGERPGTNEQRGAAYAYFAVLPGGEATLVAEAAILYPRTFAVPASLEAYLDGDMPGTAWVRRLDTSDSVMAPAARATVERAIAALPADARELFLDRSLRGGIVATTCTHCGGL